MKCLSFCCPYRKIGLFEHLWRRDSASLDGQEDLVDSGTFVPVGRPQCPVRLPHTDHPLLKHDRQPNTSELRTTTDQSLQSSDHPLLKHEPAANHVRDTGNHDQSLQSSDHPFLKHDKATNHVRATGNHDQSLQSHTQWRPITYVGTTLYDNESGRSYKQWRPIMT